VDDVYVRLQKLPQTHLELQSAIAYEGWKHVPGKCEAYGLQEK
jgi:hypothetical protein